MTLQMIQMGLGMWGRDWATRVLAGEPSVEVVGWVDPDERARHEFQAAVGVPSERLFANLDTALAATGVGAVLATVAVPVHVEVGRQVLERGAHLLLEKPFAETVAGASELVRLAAQRRLVIVIDQNYRYQPVPARLRNLLAEGSLGTVHRARVGWHRRLPPGHRPDLVTELAVHHFDLMRYIFDREAVAVTAVVRRDRPAGPANTLDALVEFAGGLVVNYSAARVGVADQTLWAAHWVVPGDAGVARWGRAAAGDDAEASDELAVRRPGRDWEAVAVPPIPRRDRAAVLHDFVSAVERGTAPLTSGADNVHTVAIVAAVVESARLGGRVTL